MIELAAISQPQFKQKTNKQQHSINSYRSVFNKMCHSDWEFERRAKKGRSPRIEGTLENPGLPEK